MISESNNVSLDVYYEMHGGGFLKRVIKHNCRYNYLLEMQGICDAMVIGMIGIDLTNEENAWREALVGRLKGRARSAI